jgi:putative glutamine amidotransferase
MPRRSRFLLVIVFLTAVLASALAAQTRPRFYDTAGAPQGRVRLAVFYPSTGTLKALLALREQGMMPASGLEIIGLHHEKEKTAYAEAEAFVRENNLDWIHFHTITADLSPETLFARNAVSAELERIFALSSGIIFFGGPDIPPALYGEKTGLLTVIDDPWRHFLELTAVFHLLGGSQDPAFKPYLEGRPDFPVLGICLGMQTLNVGTGGTLVQDIWSDIYGRRSFEDVIALGQPNWHTNPNRRVAVLDKDLLPYMLHPIRLAASGKFVTGFGFQSSDQPYVLSAHHQAAGRLGRGFKVAAASLDGKVVEAIEHVKFPFVLGLQFHPEFPLLWDEKPRYKITPRDKELFGCRPYLQSRPPSLDFHKKIWAWLFASLH